MRTIRVDLSGASVGKVLEIGSAGENLATQVMFDASKWVEAYPDGAFTLIVQRSDGATYPASVTRDGNSVTWTVAASDTLPGWGSVELTMSEGDVICKSVVLRTDVAPSLCETDAVPASETDWVQSVIAAGESAQAAAQTIAQTAAETVVDEMRDGAFWTFRIDDNGNLTIE